MAKSRELAGPRPGAGDAAVEGLFHGIAGGLAMVAVLIVAGTVTRQGIDDVLRRFDPAGAAALTGLLVHLGVSGVYGLMFGLLVRMLPWGRGERGTMHLIAGLAYGVILWTISLGLAASPAGAPIRAMPALGWALGHAAYGLALGVLASRSRG